MIAPIRARPRVGWIALGAMFVAHGTWLSMAAHAQWPNPLELNRVFLADTARLHALELDGTIAWTVPLPGYPGSTAGTTVDGRGYVLVVDLMVPTLLRYRVDGVLDLSLPIPGPPGTTIRMPAVDASGNCYLGKLVPNPLASLGYESRIIKIDPNGTILWDRDLTPELATSQPPQGILIDVKVDEDGHVWGMLADASSNYPTGGRLVRLDPQGNVGFSVPGGMGFMQLNCNRTARITLRIPAPPPLSAVPPIVRRYAFDGTLLDSMNAAAQGLVHFLSHPSSEYVGMMSVGQLIVGPGYNPAQPSPPGALPLYDNGSPAAYGVTGQDVALDPLGRIWMSGWLGTTIGGNGYTAAHAIRFGPFAPASGYPLLGSTFLSSSNWPYTSLTPRGDNRGQRFTAYDWCLIVDPWGDLDRDGVMNRNEIFAGTNPCDPQSVQGSMQISGLSLGSVATLAISCPGQAGNAYASVAALTGDLVRLPDPRGFRPQFFDPLATWWLAPGNPVVIGAVGMLNAAGAATVSVPIPNDPALAGIPLHFGFATADPAWQSGLRTLFGSLGVTIGP